ncbi:restriction endonuclease subunit S [Mammaliicoccus sciuri]|uniref:restriction endonuclease subunit S n=1 Tax=Mammaliicoccus sciuri TaxID=1296 RepID=UPI003BA37EC8
MTNQEKKIPELRFPEFDGEWENSQMGDIVNFYSGLTYSPDDVTNFGTLVLRSSNIYNNCIVDADNVYVYQDKVNSKNVSYGDVIVVVRNGSRNLIGKHALVTKNMPNTVIGAFMTGIHYEYGSFINALLSTQNFQKEIHKNLGATINQITTGVFKKMLFNFPNVNEQQKIGEFFSKLDRQIELEEQKLAKLEEQKKGYMQKIFSQELRFKDENGNEYPEWENQTIENLLKERNERSSEGDMLSVTINSGIIKFNELDRKDNSSKDKSNYKVVKKNDIAYNSMRMWQGASGKSEYDGIVSPAYTVVYPLENVNSVFIAYLFKTYKMIHIFKINSQGLTSDTWNLKYKQLKDINIKIPILAEQERIAEFFKNIDKLIEKQSNKLKVLNENKKGYLQKMFI